MSKKLIAAGARVEVARLNKIIDDAKKDIESIQSLCPHPNATKIKRGDSGNIMTGRDESYWKKCKCPDCGKQWNEDQ